ncbi:MAG: phospholipid carrier-dependent glycosyltransferase [Terriglobales bacterium]
MTKETFADGESGKPSVISKMIEEKHDRPQKSWDWRPPIILVVAVVVRVLYIITFKPWWGLDSEHYSRPMVEWAHGYFSDGMRTPIYPLFLGMCQWLSGAQPAMTLSILSAEIVRDLQCVLGLVAVYLLYDTLRILDVRNTIAFVAALFFSITTSICVVEMAILTLSLSVFSLLLGIWLYARMMRNIQRGKSGRTLAILLGLAVAFAALVRPDNLVFFAVILLVTAAFAIRSNFVPSRAVLARRLLVVCLLIATSAAPPILAWTTCNYIGTGHFRMTNMMGLQMSQPVYNMFDQVDPEDKVFGAIMTKYYRLYNQHEINREYMWRGMEELTSRASEMPFSIPANDNDRRGKLGNWVYRWASDQRRLPLNLSTVAWINYLQSVEWKLIRKHPLGYLQNAADSFVRDSFDFAPKFPAPDEKTDPMAVEGGSVLKSTTGLQIIRWPGMLQAPFLTAFYVVTLTYVLFGPLILLSGAYGNRTSDVTVVALAMGTTATIIAFCLLESYHNQYGIPYIAILLICAAYTVENFGRIWKVMKSNDA